MSIGLFRIQFKDDKIKVTMKPSDVIRRIIARPDETNHDINHLLKVYSYAKTIGEGENLDAKTQYTLELAAIVHDISCPFCRAKYGNANGKYQEAESEHILRDFFKDTDMEQSTLERIIYLVSHHHTVIGVTSIDHQILLEADYLVNAEEHNESKENIRNTMKSLFKTNTGIELLKNVFRL